MDDNKKTEKTIFYNQKTLLDDKCVICFEQPRRAKACQTCTATICDACLFELLDVWKGTKCPYCRTEIDEESMLDSWQLRYITNKTNDRLNSLTEELEKLKLKKGEQEASSVQLLVHGWVENHLRELKITNKTFEEELRLLEKPDINEI